MPDLNKIYRLILADILERLKERTISELCAIERIGEVSQEWWYWNYNDDGDFTAYVQKYYPQFLE